MIQVLESYLMRQDSSILEELEKCANCPLLGTPFVPGEGDPEADLMIVGEAPGQAEEAEGRPFVGKSGNLIRGMLDSLNVVDTSIYITNVVKRRPTTKEGSNRRPSKNECYRCGCHLAKELVEVQPKYVITLGSVPLEFFAGIGTKITIQRGNVFARKVFDVDFVVMPTYHPSYVLRSGGVTSEVGNTWVSDLEDYIQLYRGK